MSEENNKSSQQLAEERTDIAHERTDFAEDRTLLANERTFAGWGRTSFASIGLGLGFQALFGKTEPVWIPKSIATLFILLGIFLIWLARNRARQLLKERSSNTVNLISGKTFLIMAVTITIGGLALIASVWLFVGASIL